MVKVAAFFIGLALLITLPGCASIPEPAQSSYAPAEQERLVVYTSHKEEVWWPIVKEFEERTGIWVDVVAGGTNEILERIAQGRDNPQADVMFGGGAESLEFYRDYFIPYVCSGAETIEEVYRPPHSAWTPFSALPVVLIYNTKLVETGRITGWSDLFAPEFYGRIAFADPAVSGSSYTELITMFYALEGDDAGILQAFADNLGGVQLESSGSVLTAVADGTALVGVTLEETALKRIAAGDDIGLVYPADGSSLVPDGSAIVRGAPHEKNAELFLDFIVSLDVQQLLAGQYRRTIRRDLPPSQELKSLSELPMVNYDISLASQYRDALLSAWAACLNQ